MKIDIKINPKKNIMRSTTFFIILLFSLNTMIQSQESTQNYICTRTILNEMGSSYIDQIVYYDGLGRPFETVQKGITPSKQNLISLQEYDEIGRKSKSWLPISSTSDYLSSTNIINNAPSNYNNDLHPYHQSIYEPSPLYNIIQQYEPGTVWYNGHPISTEYLVNTINFPMHCINYSVNSSGSLVNNGNYEAAQLYVTKTIDEDYNISYSFIDKLERRILDRQMKDNIAYDTYYVYDDYGNLSFVLQPMYQEDNNLPLYAFQYKYDGRNRCIEKKLPGTDITKYIYDLADNLVFSQNGNQRISGQWTFFLYDKFHRLIVKGICNNTDTSSVSSQIIICTWANNNTGLGNSGYTSNLTLESPIIHQVNYYDNYDFRSLVGFTNVTYFPVPTIIAKGYLTGSINTVLENGMKLYSANYYDIKGQITKSVSSNHMGGYETTNTTYTFTGKPLTVQHIHTASGKNTQTETYTYTYDHAERITKTQHSLNGSTVTLATNTYDNLGRLLTKSLHGSSANKLTYTYNIRDWLTSIASTKFTQNLYYNTGNGTTYYNGNISSMTWKSGTETIMRGYKFTYDNLSRMKNAVYGEGPTISTNSGHFSENITDYDRNGNIRSLQRYGKTNSTTYGIIDNLTLVYNGNQLKYVNDVATDPLYSGAFNFVDGSNSTGVEYIFDNNGNLQQDYNKKVAKIQYNQLNLPSTLQFTNGNRTDYLYSADGTKKRVIHKTAIANISVPIGQIKDLTNSQISQTYTTDYCNNVIYENESLSKILTDEGYITLSGTTPTYHYYLKDHQGNNRVVISQSGMIEQVNHYYPFGSLFEEGMTTSNQAYKYNGKELDRMHGLDWYDYGARMYDSPLGRFTTIDPMAEKYYSISSYVYCNNNPVNRIDPTGKTDYHILANGQIKRTGKINDNIDRLFAANGEYVEVHNKQLLKGLIKNMGGDYYSRRFYQETSNIEDATSLFKFASDNTEKEWKLDIYKDDNGEKTAVVATDLNKSAVSITNKYKDDHANVKSKTKIVDIHSHPDENGTKGGSDTDQKTAKHNAKNAVYHKKTKILFEYNENQMSTNSIKIESYKDIIKYINQ